MLNKACGDRRIDHNQLETIVKGAPKSAAQVGNAIPLSSVKELNSITDLGRDNIVMQIQNHLAQKELSYIDNFSFNVRDIEASDILKVFKMHIGKALSYMGGSHKFVVLTETGMLVVAILVRPPNKTIHIEIEDEDIESAAKIREEIYALFEGFRKDSDSIFANVQWWSQSKHGVDYEDILEEINDTVHPEAYPCIADFDNFIKEYLNSEAQVLILMGTPGTGKTRLIRHIVKCMGNNFSKAKHERSDFSYGISEKEDHQIEVMYTIDSGVIAADRFFISFLTGEAACMILEDIDIDLSSRKDGNTTMHKLLAGSDGFLRNTNKKLIISTNLNSIADIDDALLRPGRCFDTVKTVPLNAEQAKKFLNKLGAENVDFSEKETYTLTQLYQIASGKSRSVVKEKKMGF